MDALNQNFLRCAPNHGGHAAAAGPSAQLRDQNLIFTPAHQFAALIGSSTQRAPEHQLGGQTPPAAACGAAE